MLTGDWDEGQIDRVKMSRNRDISPGLLSRIVRRMAYQTSGGFVFQAALDDGIEHVCEASFRRTGTGDRGRCPDSGTYAPGRTVPLLKLVYPDGADWVWPIGGNPEDDLGTVPLRVTVPVL